MNSKLYIQNEDGEYNEVKEAILYEVGIANQEDYYFPEPLPTEYSFSKTIRFTPTYKKWYKKKKGKRHIWYYKKKYGINPKIIKLVKGGKDE